jgi:hypothetical protein
MSFKDMMNKSTNISKLTQELEKMNKGGAESYKDDRFWRPELDKASNGFAVIRFLPPVEGEELPWVRTFNHGFKGPGGWFIENCPTTIGKKCPICEANSELWNSGSDSNKKIASDRNRKLSYIANIMVVQDPKHPENEGKVFLFKFGKKIFDKIIEKLQPESNDYDPVEPLDVFHFLNGANFKLRVRSVAGYVNYDKSEFDSPTPLLNGDATKLEALWKKEYSLKAFTDPSEFKSYEELKAKFQSVNKGSSSAPKTAEEDEIEDEEEVPVKTSMKSKPAPKIAEKKASYDEDAEEESSLSYFEKLANEE